MRRASVTASTLPLFEGILNPDTELKCGCGLDCKCIKLCKLPLRKDAPENETDIRRRFRAMESAATRLQKEAKGYLDALRGQRPFVIATGNVQSLILV